MPPAGTRLQVHLTNLPADYDLALYSSQTTSVRTGADERPAAPGRDDRRPVAQPPERRHEHAADADRAAGRSRPGHPRRSGLGEPRHRRRGRRHGLAGRGRAPRRSPSSATTARRARSRTRSASRRRRPSSSPARPGRFAGRHRRHRARRSRRCPTNLNTLILVNEKRIGDTYGAARGDERRLVADASRRRHVARRQRRRHPGRGARPGPVQRLGRQPVQRRRRQRGREHDRERGRRGEGGAAEPQVRRLRRRRRPDPVLPDPRPLADRERDRLRRPVRPERVLRRARERRPPDRQPVPRHPARPRERPPALHPRPRRRPARRDARPDRRRPSASFETSSGDACAARRPSSPATTSSPTAASSCSSGSQSIGVGQREHDARSSATRGRRATCSSAAFPAGGPAAINDWNGHYDNYRALMADGDRPAHHRRPDRRERALRRHLLHDGLPRRLPDDRRDRRRVGADWLDWAQYFAGTGTGFVGNTGFGLGNTDSVAFSEELMADFAGHLDGTLSIGQALDQAKQDYFLSRDAFSSYDEKTLSEAELYGLPMYGVGRAAGRRRGAPPGGTGAARRTRCNGATSSTSPSQGSLTPVRGTRPAQAARLRRHPDLQRPVQTGQHGVLLHERRPGAGAELPAAAAVRDAARDAAPDLTAHGVVIDSLASEDHTPFNPDNVRPTVDLTANEPEPQFTDQAWPTKVPTLVSLNDANGLQQQPQPDDRAVLHRLRAAAHRRRRAPLDADRRPRHLLVEHRLRAADDRPDRRLPRTAARVVHRPLQRPHRDRCGRDRRLRPGRLRRRQQRHLEEVQLVQDSERRTWSGGAPFTGTHVQFFVEACDTAGNCGYSSNKGRYFDAAPLPAGRARSRSRRADRRARAAGTRAPSSVTATSSHRRSVTVSVDGRPVRTDRRPAGPVTGDGSHTLDARARTDRRRRPSS